MRRTLRILAYILLGAVVLELSWLMAANTYLRSPSFRELIKKDGTAVQFESIFSPFPGLVQVEGFSVKNAETTLHLMELHLNLSLLALASKKIIFWSVAGKDGVLHYRPGLASSTQDLTWPIYFKRLQLKNLTHLIVGDFDAKGPINLDMDLELKSSDQIRTSGHIKLNNTAISWQQQTASIFHKLEGSFSLDPLQNSADFLQKLSFDLSLDAELAEDDVLQKILVDTSWLQIKGLNLRSSGRVVLENGQLAPKTNLGLRAKNLKLDLWKEHVEGEGSMSLTVDQLLELTIDLPQFSIADVAGSRLHLTLSSSERDVMKVGRAWHSALKLDQARVKDLRYFNHFLPKGLGFAFLGGQGELALSLDSQKSSGNFLSLLSPNARVVYDQQEFTGHLDQQLQIGAIDFARERFAITSGKLDLQVQPTVQNADRKAWAGQLSLSEGQVTMKNPMQLEIDVKVKAQDLRPILWVYDPESKLPDWARRLFSQEGLGASFHLKANESGYSLDSLQAKTKDLALDAWFYEQNKKKRGKLYLRYGAMSAGLGVEDESISVQLLSVKDWFREAKF